MFVSRERRFTSDRRGAVAVLACLSLGAIMASAALAIDLGDVFLKSRQLQGVADLAALSAVQALDPAGGSTPGAAASATASLNSWPGGIQAAATPGVYVADSTVPPAQRFSPSSRSPNAVQVTLTASVPLYFASLVTGRSSLQVTRTATATQAQFAAFSLGSGLVSLNGGVANALLSALTGSQVSLSVMDYSALASANVDLLSVLPALETRAGLKGATYSTLLATAVTPATALNALADVLTQTAQTQAASAAQRLALAAAGLPPAPLSALIDPGPYGAQDHGSTVGGLGLSVQALQLASAVLQAANGGRQLSADLGASLPGLAGLKLYLAIGQRPAKSPWITVTNSNQVIVRTAQMRLYLDASLASGGLVPQTGTLIDLPIFVEAASAQAKLLDLNCPATPASQNFDLSVSPSLGTLAIAQADPSTLPAFAQPVALTPATLLNLGLLKATAYGRVDLGGGQPSWQTVNFTRADVAATAEKSVYANDIARATIASLLANTNLSVQTPAGALAVGGGTLTPGLQVLLTSVAPTLDQVISNVEQLTGVRLGEADVWADGLRCRGAALAS